MCVIDERCQSEETMNVCKFVDFKSFNDKVNFKNYYALERNRKLFEETVDDDELYTQVRLSFLSKAG